MANKEPYVVVDLASGWYIVTVPELPLVMPPTYFDKSQLPRGYHEEEWFQVLEPRGISCCGMLDAINPPRKRFVWWQPWTWFRGFWEYRHPDSKGTVNGK